MPNNNIIVPESKENKHSPWHITDIVDDLYLGHLNIRSVPGRANDILYEIEPQYTHRPDLLAYDLYRTKDLWWVFAQRNLDVIRDPVYDFVAGVKIYLPQSKLLKDLYGGI